MMSDDSKQFLDIGNDLDDKWRKTGYNTDAFPPLAAAAAEAIQAPDLLSFLENHYDRYNPDYSFSNFDLYIFRNERIRIEVLHWLNHSTSIHAHSFCGAFKMLRGRSLNVESRFEITHDISHEFKVGTLHGHKSQVLPTGSIHEILPGDRFIHANFHLGRPVVTMVVRTERAGQTTPQFAYLAPHFAYDPFDRRASVAGRAAMLEVIAQIGQSGPFEAMLTRQIAQSTLSEAVQMLRHPRVFLGDIARLDRILGVAADRHPDFAPQLAATMYEERRREQAVLLRRRVRDIDQKFILALLANLSDRASILAHLAQEFPDATPTETAARLVTGIAAAGQLPMIPADAIPALSAALAGYSLAGTVPAIDDRIEALLREPVLKPLLWPEIGNAVPLQNRVQG